MMAVAWEEKMEEGIEERMEEKMSLSGSGLGYEVQIGRYFVLGG
jgi:hypothetical protein